VFEKKRKKKQNKTFKESPIKLYEITDVSFQINCPSVRKSIRLTAMWTGNIFNRGCGAICRRPPEN